MPARPRLELLERIALAPRQSLALVEAEGRRFLVATSPEGAPAFIRSMSVTAARSQAPSSYGPSAAGSEGLMVALLGGSQPGGAGILRLCCPISASACTLGFDSVDDSLRPDADHPAARDSDGHDAAGAPAGGLSLSAPGAGHADRALESHADGAGADDDLVPDDPGAQPGGSAGGRALPRRADYGLEAIDRGAQPVKHFLLRYAREKDLALFTAAGQIPRPKSRRPAHAGGGAGLHSFRAEGRIRHRRGAVSALSADRHGDRLDHHLDRHVPTAAGGGLDAVEDSAVCDGGRLEPAGQLAVEELLRETR
jgi:hypothetical protein